MQLALRRGQLVDARSILASWPRYHLRARLEHAVWSAVVDDVDGSRREARRRMQDAVVLAEPQGHVQLFVDSDPVAHRLLRRLLVPEPTPYLRRLVAACEQPPPPGGSSGGVDLSPRELLVVGYLPTRLSNAEIAAALYVSPNTIKTHLRRIYQRLGVSGRREAAEAAERLGLI
jgi:LuxR family maltose regulon positive regulatory protein